MPSLAFPRAQGNGYMDGYQHMMNSRYGGIIMWIPLVVVIVLIIYFVTQTSKGNGEKKSQETPLDILKKRYAKGEITREEYERMKHDIKD